MRAAAGLRSRFRFRFRGSVENVFAEALFGCVLVFVFVFAFAFATELSVPFELEPESVRLMLK